MIIEATDGKIVIPAHGQLWLTPKEAFELASKLMEKAKEAKDHDARKTGKDPSARQ